jgi:leucyl aminopeptidase
MPEPIQSVIDRDQAATTPADATIVGAFLGNGGPSPTTSDETLQRTLTSAAAAGFRGKLGEVLIVADTGMTDTRLIAFTGLGSSDKVNHNIICSAAAAAIKKLPRSSTIVSVLHDVSDEGVAAAVEGYALGAYRFTRYKSEGVSDVEKKILHAGADPKSVKTAVDRASAVWLARDLINEPASVLTPQELGNRAKELAGTSGLSCEVHDETWLEDQGFGGVLATASGSSLPPRFIHLTYKPEGQPSARLALVGKGVTFDSGGLSLKPAASMELMKTDMAGAAVVIAVMSALKRFGATAQVDAYIPAAENMTGSRAMRPGDVIVHHGGRTTEVTNTDAEGRLILADALAWASATQPDAVLDIATLTGSMTVALGKKASGLFASDDDLRTEILDAADMAGERVWPFPLYEDYLTELDSDVADAKNSGIRWGGAIIAAMYLKQFVTPSVPWAHLDIAGTGRSERDYLEISRGGTGTPVRTVLSWVLSR